jgi:CDP-diacylglycerol--glycerol-3-phosphate 3-phosphatidyltransferase
MKLIYYVKKINKNNVRYKSNITKKDRIVSKTLLGLIPKSVTPNQLTILRFILIPIVIYLLLTENYLIGLIIFVIATLTDLMDGALARTRNKITSWGCVYDPIADKLLIGSTALILISKFISFYLSVLIISIELVLILAVLYAYKGKIIPARMYGKLKMTFYSFGIAFLFLYSINEFKFIMDSAKIFIILGIIFGLLSPIPYLEISNNLVRIRKINNFVE